MKFDIKTMTDSINRSFNRCKFKVQKHSPEILIVTGVAGIITGAVMACKATMKVNDILDEHKDAIDDINTESENEETEIVVRSKATVYTQTGIKFVKLYAPSVIVGTLSIGCIIQSNNILRKRNVSLAAAYMAVDKGFKEYRERVVERFGKEIDHELKYGIKAKEFDKITTDENGNEVIEKEIVNIADPNAYSDYAKFFDESCNGWCKDPETNYIFLKGQMNYANELLRTRGHLFLNEVYDMLGIPRTKAGNVVGWIYDEKNPVGDNFVDFGIFDINRERVRDFVNGYERTILLDFNVDGNILDMI